MYRGRSALSAALCLLAAGCASTDNTPPRRPGESENTEALEVGNALAVSGHPIDPVCELTFISTKKIPKLCRIWHGKAFYFCSRICADFFEQDPKKYVRP